MGIKKSHALVVIDPQNDFCDRKGSLYVEGAEEDIERLARHVREDGQRYSDIFVSLDSHDVMAIFHPQFWQDSHGTNPTPFTAVTEDDYNRGKWRASSDRFGRYAEKMFSVMARKNIPSLIIWPEHCVVSTWGHNIADTLQDALAVWRDVSGGPVRYIFKGENPYTEQFSIFEGLDDSWPDTAFNRELYSRLAGASAATFAGEALSHCVEASATSYIKRCGGIPDGQEVFILSDCSSPVTGFDRKASEERLDALGVNFIDSAGLADAF
ncbi:MAG: isochorismatase family protein [Synergistaceae bacterium]|jgi:nicotinamidase-related amidase|nr:isochorismatase family protein [Synergistaceae bacterium]